MWAKTYKIITDRLVIRCYQPSDGILLKRSIDESLEHLRPWMPWAKYEPETVQAKSERLRKYRGQFDLGEDYVFGIFSKDEKVLIGSTGLHTRLGDKAREIGYWVNVNYAKKGYITEAVKALIKVGFEIEQLDRIEIRCSPENLNSQKIPRRLGFDHIITKKREDVDPDDEPGDVMIWSMDRRKYLKSDLSSFDLKAFDMLNQEIAMD